MAPLIAQVAGLVKRADGCGSGQYRAYDGYCYSRSTWHWWGRWVFAGISIMFILIVMAILIRNSRRRRRHGTQPIYGTGWMAPAPAYYPPPPQYAAQDPGAQYPPPQGPKYGEQDGYYANQPNYGNQQEGIQLQQPQHAYHRGTDTDYAPPPGPPPNAAKPN